MIFCMKVYNPASQHDVLLNLDFVPLYTPSRDF